MKCPRCHREVEGPDFDKHFFVCAEGPSGDQIRKRAEQRRMQEAYEAAAKERAIKETAAAEAAAKDVAAKARRQRLRDDLCYEIEAYEFELQLDALFQFATGEHAGWVEVTSDDLLAAPGAFGAVGHCCEVMRARANPEDKVLERVRTFGGPDARLKIRYKLPRGNREKTARLAEALTDCHDALKNCIKENNLLGWAAMQYNLGYTLQRLAESESGTGRLEEAVVAYRNALHEYTENRVFDWVRTQNNLGNTLWRLGERMSGTEKLEEALAAYQAAQSVCHEPDMLQFRLYLETKMRLVLEIINRRAQAPNE